MLTDRLGLPASMQGLFAYLVERWDGKGLPGRARREEIPLPVRIASVARDAAFQRLLGGPEFAARVVRERAGGAFDPAVAIPLADAAAEILAPDAGGVRLGGDARLRARPAVDPGGRGDRPCPGGDGRLRRPRLAVPGRPLGRGRRAGHGGGPALPSRGRRPGAGPARRAGARSRARGGPGPHLAEGGAAHAGRLGAGQAARLPLRARPRPLAVPGRARARGRLPPRASRRLGLPPRSRRRGDHAAGAPARRRRRLPRHDRAPAAPGGALARTGRRGPRPGGRRRTARPRRRHRGAGGGRAARPADRAAGGADRARGRGRRPARPRPADQAGRAPARDLGQDRRPPHPERLRQDRRLHPRGGRALRHAARAHGLGRTPHRTVPATARSVAGGKRA